LVLAALLAALAMACTRPTDTARTAMTGSPPLPTPATCPPQASVAGEPEVQTLQPYVESALQAARRMHPEPELRGFVIGVVPSAFRPPTLPITVYFAAGQPSAEPYLILAREEDGMWEARAVDAAVDFPHKVDLLELSHGLGSAVASLRENLPGHTVLSVMAMNQGCGTIWAFHASTKTGEGTQLIQGRLLADGRVELVTQTLFPRPQP
jgi:hypothetical protein